MTEELEMEQQVDREDAEQEAEVQSEQDQAIPADPDAEEAPLGDEDEQQA